MFLVQGNNHILHAKKQNMKKYGEKNSGII